MNWVNLSIWLSTLIIGIILLIMSGRKGYIEWVKERMPMSEEKIIKAEKSGAIILITISVLSLLRLLVKH